jgi:hypothetical protein
VACARKLLDGLRGCGDSGFTRADFRWYADLHGWISLRVELAPG